MTGFDTVDHEEMAGLLAGASRSVRSRLLPLAESAELRSQLHALAALLDNVAARLAPPPRAGVGPVVTAHDRVRAELARTRRIDWDELSRGAT